MKVTDTHVYFWGGYLSQWHRSKFIVLQSGGEQLTFTSAEQYMMYCKAITFDDTETANKIMQTDNPKKIKALGRQVKNFDAEKWDLVKYQIVVDANFFKFSQNEELRNALSETSGLVLVEASPHDTVWGVGLSEDDSLILDEKNWKGENLLGKALMETRWLLGD